MKRHIFALGVIICCLAVCPDSRGGQLQSMDVAPPAPILRPRPKPTPTPTPSVTTAPDNNYSEIPPELSRYFQIKSKYDDLKFSDKASDFDSPRFKEFKAASGKDRPILSDILNRYFRTAGGMEPNLLAGSTDSYCVDGTHDYNEGTKTGIIVTDTILVCEWQERSGRALTVRADGSFDLAAFARQDKTDLICDDANHGGFKEIELPRQKNFDQVYASVNGTTQDAPPKQPDELTVFGLKGTRIYVVSTTLSGNFKDYKTNKALKKKLQKQALSLLALARVEKCRNCTQDNISEALEVCRGDIKKYCRGVVPGQGRLVKCLRDNLDKLYDPCADLVNRAPAAPDSQATRCYPGSWILTCNIVRFHKGALEASCRKRNQSYQTTQYSGVCGTSLENIDGTLKPATP